MQFAEFGFDLREIALRTLLVCRSLDLIELREHQGGARPSSIPPPSTNAWTIASISEPTVLRVTGSTNCRPSTRNVIVSARSISTNSLTAPVSSAAEP